MDQTCRSIDIQSQLRLADLSNVTKVRRAPYAAARCELRC